MPDRMAVCLMALGAGLCAGRLGAQTGSMKVTPAALAFTHQTGAATLPKPQSLAVSGTSSPPSCSR